MGCDIHDYVEVRKNGKWEKVGKIFPNPYHDEKKETKIYDDYEWNARLIEHPFHVRSYDTFAILANVRNGSGFAGCNTGNGFISFPHHRGLPADVSEGVLKKYSVTVRQKGDDPDESGTCDWRSAETWVIGGTSYWIERDKIVSDPDAHSASYLSLVELEAYDWQQTTKHRGIVDYKQYQEWKKKGKPSSWSGGVWGGSIQHVSHEEMDQHIQLDTAEDCYTRVE